jgi:hypothetical protein
VLAQHASDGVPLAPIDPKVLQTIAAGSNQQVGAQVENGINWLQRRLSAGHPILNGQPTEVRG